MIYIYTYKHIYIHGLSEDPPPTTAPLSLCQMHGMGSMTWPDGRFYKGGFVEDRKSGEGSLTWPDGRLRWFFFWEMSDRSGGNKGDVHWRLGG